MNGSGMGEKLYKCAFIWCNPWENHFLFVRVKAYAKNLIDLPPRKIVYLGHAIDSPAPSC